MPSLKTLCLFSGCGGLDLGFSRAGFSIETAIDHNKSAVATHQRNMPGVAIEGDLSNPIDFGSIKYDVVIGGPPCQGFSLAGKRRIDDPRNSLIARFIDVALAAKPKVIVMENVPGLLYGDLTTHLTNAKARLNANGYCVKTIKLDTSTFGVPQHRTRVVLVGWKNGKSDIELIGHGRKTFLRDAIENLSSSTSDHDVKQLSLDSNDHLIASRVGPGMKLSNVRAGERSVHTWHIPEVFGRTSKLEREVLETLLRLRRQLRRRDHGDADPVTVTQLSKHIGQNLISKKYIRRIDMKYVDLTNTFNGKYRRLSLDNLSYTVDTYFGNPSYILHPEEHRGMTVREAARIQTFPDTFEFQGPIKEKYNMIGNAVPPLFAEHIANQIRTQLLA
jgi:DNA (cytosine-5)-methyltransferase 1